MKGCALRALVQVAALVAAVGVVGWWLITSYQLRITDVIGVSVLVGLLIWIAGSVLLSVFSAWREKRALADSIAGKAPRDGERTILVGHLEVIGKPLEAPLSGGKCVAYWFEVWEMRGSGKTRSKAVYLDGLALTPTRIVTNAGIFKLLAVPQLDCDSARLERSAAAVRATALWQRTPYSEPLKPFSGRPSAAEEWNDTDGDYQRIVRRTDAAIDLAHCTYDERMLAPGDRVCVFGKYSEAQRAIVPDTHDWSKITRVMKGEASDVVRQLGRRIVRRLLVVLISLALAGGALAAFTGRLG